jgi:hypothetical protein
MNNKRTDQTTRVDLVYMFRYLYIHIHAHFCVFPLHPSSGEPTYFAYIYHTSIAFVRGTPRAVRNCHACTGLVWKVWGGGRVRARGDSVGFTAHAPAPFSRA